MTVMLPLFHIHPQTSWAGGIEPPAYMRLLPRGPGLYWLPFQRGYDRCLVQYTGNHHVLDQRLVKTTLSTL